MAASHHEVGEWTAAGPRCAKGAAMWPLVHSARSPPLQLAATVPNTGASHGRPQQPFVKLARRDDNFAALATRRHLLRTSVATKTSLRACGRAAASPAAPEHNASAVTAATGLPRAAD